MANKNTSLKNREFGYQFSGVEYSLIFENENIGFVRFVDQSENLFYLDPSPFLNTPKAELYVLENLPFPKRGELIEVSVSGTDHKIQEIKGTFFKTIIKYVRNWKKINPNILIHRKTLQPVEFKNFFIQAFKGDREYIEQIGYCLSLYAVSSPQNSDYEKGGLNSAMLSNNKQWNTFRRIMEVIPSEFKQTSARNFYKLLDKEKLINPINSAEVSLAYHNPISMPVQIPVALDVETKSVSDYKDNIEYEIPMVRAYMLDALLFQPEIPQKLDSYVTDCVYNLIDDIKKSGSIPYNQHLGSAIPKLSSSFARLNFQIETTKDDIIKCVDLWSDMFFYAKKAASTQLTTQELYKLSGNARKLYIDLNENFGIDILVDRECVKENSNLSEWDLEEALRELDLKGAIYCPDMRHIKLLDFK